MHEAHEREITHDRLCLDKEKVNIVINYTIIIKLYTALFMHKMQLKMCFTMKHNKMIQIKTIIMKQH